MASEIIKKVFLIQEIQPTVMKISKDHFKSFLSNSSVMSGRLNQDKSHRTETNMLQLFEYFNSINEDFREYTYQILKEFSEE
jgi:hypothetical protein